MGDKSWVIIYKMLVFVPDRNGWVVIEGTCGGLISWPHGPVPEGRTSTCNDVTPLCLRAA